MTKTRGIDLKVGDTVEVWWLPGGDQIIHLSDYIGPLNHLFPMGAKTACFMFGANGMTIDNSAFYNVKSR